jgi:hypothetical protein
MVFREETTYWDEIIRNFIENNMYPESLLINKLKWFLIQFIKKYQKQYRYLGKYLLGQI